MTDRIFITGVAGFIGFTLAHRLLSEGRRVVGVDTLNAYYSPALKRARLGQLQAHSGFTFDLLDITDTPAMLTMLRRHNPATLVHLAAQPGVRYSLKQPQSYIDSNITGTLSVLEACRHHRVDHLIYASSSSVYGANRDVPFSALQPCDHPLNLYAASKRAGELMAHSYSHLFGIPATGLRFFTVYGPWGRPDMAYYAFACAMLRGEPIDVFNHGDMQRDFTYVDDIVESMVRLLDKPPSPAATGSADHSAVAPHRIYNIGHSRPVRLGYFIETLEQCLGVRAQKRMLPMQPGDVLITCADTTPLEAATGYAPHTSIEQGLNAFAQWLKSHPEFQQFV